MKRGSSHLFRDRRVHHFRQPLAHFVRRLVRESDREDMLRRDAIRHEKRHARRDDARLPRARPREDEQWPLGGAHRAFLLGIEIKKAKAGHEARTGCGAHRRAQGRGGKSFRARVFTCESALVSKHGEGESFSAMKPILFSLVLSVLISEQNARAEFTRPESVPITRLIATAQSVLDANPKIGEAHYTLARIHYLAFSGGTKELATYPPDTEGALPAVFGDNPTSAVDGEAERRARAEIKGSDLPLADFSTIKRLQARKREKIKELIATGWLLDKIPESEAASHVSAAIQHFQLAIKLDPKKSLYQLGYASLLEPATRWARRHPLVGLPEVVRKATEADVREAYRRAWAMELPTDLKDREMRGLYSPMAMVSYEAGQSYVRLAERIKKLPAEEKKTLAVVRRSLPALERGTGGAITPIVFTTHPAAALGELLTPDHVVDFPLRGWGPDGHWPWVKAGTAILVWNPSRSGHIASGAQLFGGYTWELFWKTGYEPLAVLDADGDGELRGAELDGLAAWFDRNGNGISDPGEVQPLRDIGVVALSTRATTTEGRHPMNATGITFTDGRVLPTWDWMVEPVDATPLLSRRSDWEQVRE